MLSIQSFVLFVICFIFLVDVLQFVCFLFHLFGCCFFSLFVWILCPICLASYFLSQIAPVNICGATRDCWHRWKSGMHLNLNYVWLKPAEFRNRKDKRLRTLLTVPEMTSPFCTDIWDEPTQQQEFVL